MDIVLFHSGKELPKFLEYTFRQIRLFNPTITIYFLTDCEHLDNVVFVKYGVLTVLKDTHHSDKITELESLYNHKSYDFWTITMTRLIYIENFIHAYKLKNVYHFENDVLLYYDLSVYHRLFTNLYKTLSITTGGQDKSMTGFLFIKTWRALADMTQFFIDTLHKYGIKETMLMYKMDMVNEMTLMRVYGKERTSLSNLPILPYGEFSDNYEKFNSIFDPASWGQFVGGTTDGIVGAKPKDHYIGQELLSHPEYTVIWKRDTKDRNIPYFKFNGSEVKINNLHIHSKNLSKYTS